MAADPRRVKELFVAALDLPEAPARQAFLDHACGGDADLRQRVAALLRAHDDPASVLEQPLAAVAAGPNTSVPGWTPSPEETASGVESAGSLIAGRYRLVEAVGEGGLG